MIEMFFWLPDWSVSLRLHFSSQPRSSLIRPYRYPINRTFSSLTWSSFVLIYAIRSEVVSSLCPFNSTDLTFSSNIAFSFYNLSCSFRVFSSSYSLRFFISKTNSSYFISYSFCSVSFFMVMSYSALSYSISVLLFKCSSVLASPFWSSASSSSSTSRFFIRMLMFEISSFSRSRSRCYRSSSLLRLSRSDSSELYCSRISFRNCLSCSHSFSFFS